MTISLITPIGEPPSRSDPVNFPTRADAFLGALPLFASELNSFANSANELISEMQVIDDSVQASYNNILALANVVKWTSGSTYAEGVVVFSPTTYQNYRRTANSPGSSTTDPASDTTRWVQLSINATASLTIPGNFVSGTNAGAGNAALEVGTGRVADGGAYIDLTSQASADYNFRIIKNTGVNGSTQILHRGTGGLIFNNEQNGDYVWQSGGTERFRARGTDGLICWGANSTINGLGGAYHISSGSVNSGIAVARFSADASGSGFNFLKSRGVGHNVHGAVLNGDQIFAANFTGSDGTNPVNAGIFEVTAVGTASTGNVGAQFRLYTRNAAGSLASRMTLTREGTLLVGPSVITSGSVTANLQVVSADAQAGIAVARFSADSGGPVYFSSKSRNSSVNGQSAVLANDVLGSYNWQGSDGANFITAAQLDVAVEGTPSSNNVGAEFRFRTRNAAGTLATRMKIDREGNSIFTSTAAPPTLAVNGEFTLSLTSNTNLRISARGTDGTTRVANITLA